MSTSTAPRADAPPAGGVFSRSASGLIRVAGSWDVFIFNVGLVSVGIAIAFNQYYGPSLYPGAEPAISTLLAALGMCFAAATFYFWSTIFPRSGGVYVILSRTTHSSLAFLFSLLETVILLYYGALAASLLVQVGLGSFFATVGSIGGNDTLVGWAGDVTGARGTFWIGTGVLLLAGLLLATGTRRYFTVQRVVFVVAVVATFVTLLVMLFGSRSSFQSNLTELTGLKYDSVISTAKEEASPPRPASTGARRSSSSSGRCCRCSARSSRSASAGRSRRSARPQLFGMLGAVIATGLLIALFAVLSNKAFGQSFQGAVAFNSLSGIADGSTEGSIGAAPYFTTLAGILANNSFLAVIIMAAFVAWFWFWIPAEIAYTTRSMIAWSFDRLVPSQMGYVSRRFHTPVVAIAIGTAGSIVFMWLIAFHGIALLTLIEALLVIWGSAMAVASCSRGGQAVLQRLARAGLPVPRTAADVRHRRDHDGVLRHRVRAAVDRRQRRRRAVRQGAPDRAVDHRRDAGGRGRVVHRQQAVPPQPGRRHRAGVQADPDRVVPSWALIQEEAMALVAGSTAAGMTVRIVGSTGIRLHCEDASATMDSVERPAKDIDVVVRHGDRGALRQWLEQRGWVVDRDLLVAMEGARFAFHHPDAGLDLDVFVERLEFCHTIRLDGRWDHHPTTIPIEDLLLQKLQVHDITESDVLDAAIVLATHDVAPDDGHREVIDCGYVAGLLARDWGFHRDATANLERIRDAASALAGDRAQRVHAGTAKLREAIDDTQKSRAWRMRARVGERMQWWEDVSEREDTY